MPKQQVEHFYDIFSREYSTTHSNRFVDKIFEHFIIHNLPKKDNLKILDAGAGIGRFSFPLALRGHSLTLTDVSAGMLNKARGIAKNLGLQNITFVKESVTNMTNQETDKYDVVLLMNGVLDYSNDHKKALQEVLRVLKPSGIVIGTVNNRFIYTSTNILLQKKDPTEFYKAFNTGNYRNGFPIHDFTLEELTHDLLQAGLQLIDVLGPTNLLRKWEYENVINNYNEGDILSIQILFAKKKEYLNNSSDFLFIARKS